MLNFILIQNITLDRFNCSLYTYENYNGNIISNEQISNYMNTINNQETAIELAQILSSFDGVKKIQIRDKNDTILLEVSESLN